MSTAVARARCRASRPAAPRWGHRRRCCRHRQAAAPAAGVAAGARERELVSSSGTGDCPRRGGKPGPAHLLSAEVGCRQEQLLLQPHVQAGHHLQGLGRWLLMRHGAGIQRVQPVEGGLRRLTGRTSVRAGGAGRSGRRRRQQRQAPREAPASRRGRTQRAARTPGRAGEARSAWSRRLVACRPPSNTRLGLPQGPRCLAGLCGAPNGAHDAQQRAQQSAQPCGTAARFETARRSRRATPGSGTSTRQGEIGGMRALLAGEGPLAWWQLVSTR